MYEQFLITGYQLETQLLLQDGDTVGYVIQGLELIRMMKNHCADRLDLFDISLSIAKSITYVLEAENKNLIFEINQDQVINFFQDFSERTKEQFGEKREYIEVISEAIAYLSVMTPMSPIL